MEFALFLPFLLFMFVGAFDFGFYANALITTENAARVAALYTSSGSASVSDSTNACRHVLAEFTDVPNTSGLATCTAAPLTVTASSVTRPRRSHCFASLRCLSDAHPGSNSRAGAGPGDHYP